MKPSIVTILALSGTTLVHAQDRIDDQAAIYWLVLDDVARSIATPAMLPGQLPALAPFTYSVEQLREWEPVPQPERMSDTLISLLQGRHERLPICEPVSDQGCRGAVRGSVVRVSALSWNDPRTVAVFAQLTQARSERDYAVVTPRPLYYSYVLVLKATGWRILRAYRATPDPRTA